MSQHSVVRGRHGVVLLLAASLLAPQVTSAQAISDQRDQPTPATVPQRTETGDAPGSRPISTVAPPSAISASTAVTTSERKGKTIYTNPLDHLPARDRAATGGRGE